MHLENSAIMIDSSHFSEEKAKIHIIYVDDDAEDHEIFAEALKELGENYQLIPASGCPDLLECLESNKQADIIFMDINMPQITGIECLKLLKDNERYKDIPVIIFSVSKSQADIDTVYELGAHYHMIKPVAHLNLIASLKIILEINWKSRPARPSRDNFIINLAYI
jgi:CheY-like chemotaxis protein